MAKFEKGNPGGPGRPKGSGKLDLGGWSDRVGIPLLKRIAEGQEKGFKFWKPRLQAALTLIAYEKGKPIQAVDLADSAGSIADALASALGRGNGAGAPEKGA